ncbi:MAG: hypothetical protein U0X71_06010 [Sphingobacteriaceae bacterium]
MWGTDNPDYIPFILSGIIGMTIASDGLFAIGPVVKEYYASGLINTSENYHSIFYGILLA